MGLKLIGWALEKARPASSWIRRHRWRASRLLMAPVLRGVMFLAAKLD
jgi:hypothetical protein